MEPPDAPALERLPEDWSRALAVVAHPDDLEYGVASAVAKWTASGKSITYVLATRGEAGIDGIDPAQAGPLRADEERASAAVVGVHDVEFLDHRDGVIEYGLALRRDIARAVRRHRPEMVLSINYRDSWGGPSVNMADHRNLGWSLIDGVRDAANRWVFPDLVDEGHEPWSGVRMICFNASPVSTHGVDVTGYVDRGVASLREHRAYLEHVGQDPDTMVSEAARAAGERLGVEHGVLFEVVTP